MLLFYCHCDVYRVNNNWNSHTLFLEHRLPLQIRLSLLERPCHFLRWISIALEKFSVTGLLVHIFVFFLYFSYGTHVNCQLFSLIGLKQQQSRNENNTHTVQYNRRVFSWEEGYAICILGLRSRLDTSSSQEQSILFFFNLKRVIFGMYVSYFDKIRQSQVR